MVHSLVWLCWERSGCGDGSGEKLKERAGEVGAAGLGQRKYPSGTSETFLKGVRQQALTPIGPCSSLLYWKADVLVGALAARL